MLQNETAESSKGDILIVDDTPANIKVLAKMLSDAGYYTRITTNGARALDAVAAERPDLIMLDITMPDMDGYEVCRRLKADADNSNIPVIFISALDDVFDKVKAFSIGGIDYVTKPFQFEEVLARVASQLKIHRLQRDLEAKNSELARKNEELVRSQRELVASYQQADLIFYALSNTLAGSVLDEKYLLEEKIGSGGYGMVYRGKQLIINRPVAIKVFNPAAGRFTKEEVEKFRLEGIAAARITHPNAITVLDFCVSTIGVPYLVMELLSGSSLEEVITQQNLFSLKRTIEVALPICEVLALAHSVGIVHRDIKASNIFLHKANDKEVVKLLDFGIAKLLEDSKPNKFTSDSIVGTPEYISPERWMGLPYSGKADVYSLGILLYYMLTGTLPFHTFDNNHFKIMWAHIEGQPIPLQNMRPDLPAEIGNIVLRALSKDAELRPSASELALELKALAN